MDLPIMWVKRAGENVLINVSDFDPKLHKVVDIEKENEAKRQEEAKKLKEETDKVIAEASKGERK